MKAYAQKQNQPQQQVSSDISRSRARSLTATPMVDSNLHLQRTIRNQAVQRLMHSNAEGLDAGSDTSAPARFAHDFSRIPVHSKAPGRLQAKLRVNTPGDMYEQEADRVAERVTSMAEPQLQRSCACGGGCPGCQNGQAAPERLLMKNVQGNHVAGIEAPPIVNEVLRSSGQPLDRTTQGFMESRFGHDFSHVRLHADARAAESARMVNALAYTTGHHVVFGKDQYAPGTGGGRRLLAHELTHVMQQSPVHTPLQLPSQISQPSDAVEVEAARVVATVMNISPSAPDVKIGGGVQHESGKSGCEPPRISASPRAIFRQVDPTSLVKRVFVPGRVMNKSKKAVTVWSSDVGMEYTIAAGSTSEIFEDVDHIKDEQGQWYKIGSNIVVVHADGKISGYKCKVKGPSEDCPKELGLEKPERSLTPAVSTGITPKVNLER